MPQTRHHAILGRETAERTPIHPVILLALLGLSAPPAHAKGCGTDHWRMGRLDDLAWVYAVENATAQKTEQKIDYTNPPRDEDILTTRDACTDETCLCNALIDRTKASLGGSAPYPQ